MTDEFIAKLAILLHGKIPDSIDTQSITDESNKKLAGLLNELFVLLQEIHEFITPLSQGKLKEIKVPQPKNFLSSPFKELHSHLLHLTWQTKQVAKGDYNQRVDFMGDFSEAFNSMVTSLDNNEKALTSKIDQLEKALSHITRLEGILPICSCCKKIRLEGSDPMDQRSWVEIENYIGSKTEAQFSHSICPQCMKKFYSDLMS